ncbi:MAG: GTP cyclohydrolase II [Bacteroidota bacterium]
MIEKLVEAEMPTVHGIFKMVAFDNEVHEQPHLAMVRAWDPEKPALVRIHSECLTGDLMGSVRCDCGEQLDHALKMVSKEGGVVVYLRQEGRGIGLVNKLKAYNLQDQGLNTREANLHLGFQEDARNYGIAIEILKAVGVTKIRLMTNNPDKLHAFDDSGIELVERVPSLIPPRKENLKYLQTKQDEMGHLLDIKAAKGTE